MCECLGFLLVYLYHLLADDPEHVSNLEREARKSESTSPESAFRCSSVLICWYGRLGVQLAHDILDD